MAAASTVVAISALGLGYIGAQRIGRQAFERGLYALQDGDVTEAKRLLQRASLLGRGDADFYLGTLALDGDSPQANSQALSYWQRAAARGVVAGMVNLGTAQIDSEATAAAAVQAWQQASGRSDALAQFNLGIASYIGQGTAKNVAAAADFWRRAAALGSARAAYNLAVLSLPPLGQTGSWQPSLTLFRNAARSGEPLACFNTAVILMEWDQGLGEAQRMCPPGFLNYYLPCGTKAGWEEATTLLRDAEVSGLPGGQRYRGLSLWKTQDDIPAQADAIAALAEASAEGDSEASFLLATLLLNQESSFHDAERGLHLLSEAADHGDGGAQLLLSLRYHRGDGVRRSESKSLELLRQAAEAGVADAQGLLGVAYFGGRGLSEDDRLAKAWLMRAANQGSLTAQVALAQAYAAADLHGADLVQALRWALIATANPDLANSADVSADLLLLRQRLTAQVKPDDQTTARRMAYDWHPQLERRRSWDHALQRDMVLKWAVYADLPGHSTAQDVPSPLDLSLSAKAPEAPLPASETLPQTDLSDGSDETPGFDLPPGMSREDGKDAGWFREGEALADGKDGAPDPATAFALFQHAAIHGYAPAQARLGQCYREGVGIAQDDEKAVEWYRKAANQGFAEAQFELGQLYESGKGVAKDAKTAAEWYRRAAAHGDSDATDALDRLEPRRP